MNALRHSLASYHLGKFQDAPALALQMGYTTMAMLFAYYREVVTPDAAGGHNWKMTPEKNVHAQGHRELARTPALE